MENKEHTFLEKLNEVLNGIFWYEDEEFDNIKLNDITPFKINPQYSSDWEQLFGNLPCTCMILKDVMISTNKYNELLSYLSKRKFIVKHDSGSKFTIYNPIEGILIEIENDVNRNIVKKIKKTDTDYGYQDIPEELAGEPVVSIDEDESLLISEPLIVISMTPKISSKNIIKDAITELYESSIIEDLPETNNNRRFYMIAQSRNGLYCLKTNFQPLPVKGDRFDLYYGKSFPDEKIKKFLDNDTENLLLLHGDPGTGKSNYIKHLISNSDKKIIYIPPSMLSVISSPDFVSFMMDNKNSILLIEDAEQILSADRNSATNNLLGLTDGFLKDAMKLKIIATFNCDIGAIDQALLRKGRLYFHYQFGKLKAEDARELASYLNLNIQINDDINLCEIFNTEDNQDEKSFEKRSIGFF